MPHYLDYSSFITSFNIEKFSFFKFVLLFQYRSAILSPLNFHINFRISMSISVKNAAWIFYRDCVESVDQFEGNFILILSLPIHKCVPVFK